MPFVPSHRCPGQLLTATFLLLSALSAGLLPAQEAASPPAAGDAPAAVTAAPETEASPSPPAEPVPIAEKPKIPPAPLPYILRPYDVRVLISLSRSAALPASLRERWMKDVESLLSSRFRQMWQLSLSEAVEQDWQSPQDLLELSSESATQRFLPDHLDKVFLVVVEDLGGEMVLHCREWDASTRTLSSLYVQQVYDRRNVPAEIANIVSDAFRPVVLVDIIDGETIECLVRAGEFPPRSEEVIPFQTGDFLAPFLSYLDRNKEVRMVQAIPWTYLKVEEITRSRMRLSQVSAFRSPIPASRRRVEVVALRIRPHLPATEVVVYPRGGRNNPLAGFRCEMLDRLPSDQDPVEDRLKLMTDRRGIVTVPANQEHPLQFLHVYSGAVLVARVPMVPGAEPQLAVEVPDDQARLRVEGEVELLEGELIDIIATREVLMARARAAANQSKWEDVDRFLKELQKLPTLEQFLSRVGTLQVQAVYAAQQARDRVAEGRINRLCAKIRGSAEKFLDPFRIVEFRQEMNAQRPKK